MFTAAYLSAQNTEGSTIALTPDGAVIPLADNVVAEGITAAGSEFTVDTAGTYYIAYQLNVRDGSVNAVDVRVNGVPAAGLESSTAVTTQYGVAAIVPLAAGEVITLTAAGEESITLKTPDGASLIMIRLGD